MSEEEYVLYLKSKELISNNNVKEGMEILDKLAKKKNKNAIFDIGMLYYKGELVEKDLTKACYLLTYAGDLGYKEAYYQLGKLFYYELHNSNESERFLLKCNDGKSKFLLGLIYYNISKSKAVTYFMYAFRCHNPSSCYYLAKCYFDGEGVKKDLIKASYYLKHPLCEKVEDIFGLREKIKLIETFY